jgi:hypothetical protein
MYCWTLKQVHMEKLTGKDLLEDEDFIKEFKEVLDAGIVTADELADCMNAITEVIEKVGEDQDQLIAGMKIIPQIIAPLSPIMTRLGKVFVSNLRSLQLAILEHNPKSIFQQNVKVLQHGLSKEFTYAIATELAFHYYLSKADRQRKDLSLEKARTAIEKMDAKQGKLLAIQLFKPNFGEVGTMLQGIVKLIVPIAQEAMLMTQEQADAIAKEVWKEYVRCMNLFDDQKSALDCAKKRIELFF